MSRLTKNLKWVLLFNCFVFVAQAVVMYDEGREFIDGISLLRDKEDPKSYYYLPTIPRVAIDPVSQKPRMFVIKFVDPSGKTSGGLLHFLFTMDLPASQIESLNTQLAKKVPGASIKGPVNLRAEGDEENNGASFKIISSTVTENVGKDSFTSTLVSSGVAPVTPGSQAAVAARLSEHGATLLWESLMRPTSDISVTINASYEAALPAYRGKVYANMDTVYKHFFKIFNQQKNYTKTEVRKQMDELVRTGVIEVDITDRNGLGINSSQLSTIMNMVTDKLVQMLFDTAQGFSKLPEQEKIPANVVKGRQKRGFLAKLFAGTGNQKYVTDDQFTMREKKDIKRATFSMLFTQNTTIKVPFNSTGNIGGLFEAWGDDESLFRTVGLNDAAFEKREVFFEVDPTFYNAFKENINSVSVSFTKTYPALKNQADFTSELVFNHNDISEGSFTKSLIYPRLGIKGSNWHDYQYRALWSFRGGKTLGIPKDMGEFQANNAPSVTLSPPAELTQVEIDGDATTMIDAKIRRAMVEFKYKLLGESKRKTVALLPNEKEILQTTSLLHDKEAKIKYRVRWYSMSGTKNDGWKTLEDSYLFLIPESN
jgi:hypothetical protein